MFHKIRQLFRKYPLLSSLLKFSLIIAGVFVFAFYEEQLLNGVSFKNIYTDLVDVFDHDYAEKLRTSEPNQFYQTAREVKVAILSQSRFKDENLNRNVLQKAVLSLFNNLKNDQHYDSLIVLLDPQVAESDPDLFAEQAAHDFPGVKYSLIRTGQLNETELLNKLNGLVNKNSLVILQSYLSTNSTDPDLQQIQQDFFKDVYDYPTKASLLSLGYSNKEGLKAVYQYAKSHAFLKSLPTLVPAKEQYQIKYLTEGQPQPTRIATLTFFGDVMLGRTVRTLMDSTSLDYPFLKMDAAYLQKNSLLIANLEGPIANQAVKTSKSIAFRFLPDVAPLLASHYFDLLSVANNHALDMGEQGYQDDRVNLLQAGLTPFGDPRQMSENAISKQTINGLNFAFIGLNNTDFKIDQEKTLNTIRDLANQGYLVIPFIHWGVEYQHNPSKEQIELAHAMVDAGAAAVIGMHPHVVESFEIYNNKPIFYSLGNAIFDQYFSNDVQEGLSLTMRFEPDQLEIYFVPVKILASQFQLMNADQKAEFLQRFTGYWRYDQDIKEQIEKGKIVLKYNKN
jgi:poly-gamma-glutamate synthesis protein (capsule biosynthesis protein)